MESEAFELPKFSEWLMTELFCLVSAIGHLAGNVADMLATCRGHAQMSLILAKKCMSGRHELVPDTGNLRQ